MPGLLLRKQGNCTRADVSRDGKEHQVGVGLPTYFDVLIDLWHFRSPPSTMGMVHRARQVPKTNTGLSNPVPISFQLPSEKGDRLKERENI